LRNKVRVLLIACSVALGVCAIMLASYIWQGTPFFNMNLVFLEVIVVLLVAASIAIAMMSPCDRETD